MQVKPVSRDHDQRNLPPNSLLLDPRLAPILNQMPVLVWTTDTKLRCTAAIGGAGLPAGIEAKRLLGKTVQQIMYPAFRESLDGHRQALRGIPARYRAKFRGRIFEASIAPLLGSSGEVCGAVGAALDVTERHQAEQLAARTERLFRAVVDRGWEGLVLNDRDGRVMYCNPAGLRILGLKEEEVIGKAGMDLMDPRDLAQGQRFRDELRKRAGRTLTIEARMAVPKGRGRWIEYTSTNLLDDPDVEAVVGKFRDISARKEAESKIEELSRRMVRLQQEEERRIARELHDSTSQCLAALMLNLAAAKQSQGLPRRVSSQLVKSLELARQTAVEIRTASYLLHPPTLEEFGIVPAVEEYVRGFRERSGITVKFRKPRQELQPLASEAEVALFRIIQEALSNVHRHSCSKQAEVRISVHGDRLDLEINDDGKGLPKRLLRSLNQQSQVVGAGVGLNGIRERVRQLNGRFVVEDRRPGTGIRTEIPLVPTALESAVSFAKRRVAATRMTVRSSEQV